jgi:protein-disulfide isomerase
MPELLFQASERLPLARAATPISELSVDRYLPRLRYRSVAGRACRCCRLCAPASGRRGHGAKCDSRALAKPMSLPDMALGSPKASVTIVEYASMSCPHCAAFEENVFPMLTSKYIDTGTVRFVFREFPLDIKAAAASMLARCIAKDDAGKFFGAIDTLFKQQDPLIEQTKDTLKLIGAQAGMSEQAVEACEKDQALLDKLSADQKFAYEVLKVDATPTFFINGEKLKGAMSFEELDKKIRSLMKH